MSKQKAMALLEKWCRDHTGVQFIESNLRIRGVICGTSSPPSPPAFTFFGYSGITAPVIPGTWNKAWVEETSGGGIQEIHAELKSGEGYKIRRGLSFADERAVAAVHAHLERWKEQGKKLHISLIHACYALAFSGTITDVVDVFCFIQHAKNRELLVLSLSEVLCCS